MNILASIGKIVVGVVLGCAFVYVGYNAGFKRGILKGEERVYLSMARCISQERAGSLIEFLDCVTE